jgi:hypothetical protein
MAGVIEMSDRELTRLRVIIDLADDRLTVDAAATLMGLGRRQIYRLRLIFSADGPAGLASRKRGRPSNRKHGETFRATVLSLVREQYSDFGPRLAAEKLIARHGLRIGVETLRQWMMAERLWVDRRYKLPSPHQPRRRRECLGELVQIDGSEHRWFEDRGEMCTLLAFVDDATSRLMRLRFVASESAFDYFRATKDYLETHGKPVAFYSDKHGIFRVNAKDAIGGDRVTQFGRVLSELNIDIICANSPQAKGRVERAFGTLQDRLAKELRLAGISTIEAANAWVPAFMVDYNTRFGRAPENAKDLHRKLTEADDLSEVLAWREKRTVTKNLTLHYDRMMLLLDRVSAVITRVSETRTGSDAACPRPGAQDGRCCELSGRPVRGSVRRGYVVVPQVRQDPDRGTWRDRGEQAAWRGTGDNKAAPGHLRAEPSSLSPGAAAAAEQPRSTGPADKGTAFAPDRGCGGGRALGGGAEP